MILSFPALLCSQILRELSSPFVVRLFDVFTHKSNVWVAMELCTGDLEAVVKGDAPLCFVSIRAPQVTLCFHLPLHRRLQTGPGPLHTQAVSAGPRSRGSHPVLTARGSPCREEAWAHRVFRGGHQELHVPDPHGAVSPPAAQCHP